MHFCLRAAAPLICIAFLTACASSPMSRIDANRAQYDSYPLEIRQAILDGRIEKGMTPDMVQMILGKPTEVTVGRAIDEEIWIYRSGGGGLSNVSIGGGVGIGGVNVGTSGVGGGGGGYEEYREITFKDGQVLRGDDVR